MRTTFSARGLLTGMGREAFCVVMGTRRTKPDGSAGELVRLSVYKEPPKMPDGPYDLAFEGQTEKVWRTGGSGSRSDDSAAVLRACSLRMCLRQRVMGVFNLPAATRTFQLRAKFHLKLRLNTLAAYSWPSIRLLPHEFVYGRATMSERNPAEFEWVLARMQAARDDQGPTGLSVEGWIEELNWLRALEHVFLQGSIGQTSP